MRFKILHVSKFKLYYYKIQKMKKLKNYYSVYNLNNNIFMLILNIPKYY